MAALFELFGKKNPNQEKAKKWISTIRVLGFWKCQKYLMVGRNERNGIAGAIPFLSHLTMFS